MNERIKELAEQASSNACYDEPGQFHLMNDEIEKFAELIVQECLDVMSKTSEEANARFTYMGDDVPTVVHQSKIEKHFGIEK